LTKYTFVYHVQMLDHSGIEMVTISATSVEH